MSQKPKTKIALLGKAQMGRIAFKLPPSKAASIGRTIARHSFLEHLKAQTINALLGISIKQGRVAIRLPQPRLYVAMIEDLLLFHKIHTSGVPWNNYAKKLARADVARNLLAHSLFIEDPETKKLVVQMVKGDWDNLPDDVIPINRALNPQGTYVDRAFLRNQRKAVEDAIKQAIQMHGFISAALRTLNERRAKEPSQDRRNRPGSA